MRKNTTNQKAYGLLSSHGIYVLCLSLDCNAEFTKWSLNFKKSCKVFLLVGPRAI